MNFDFCGQKVNWASSSNAFVYAPVLYFWLLSRGFSSVPGPNLSAVSFETSEEFSCSIHTKTKLNHKNNLTKDNFILNVQILFLILNVKKRIAQVLKIFCALIFAVSRLRSPKIKILPTSWEQKKKTFCLNSRLCLSN